MSEALRPLRVFLCHSSVDKPAVRTLFEKLLEDGVQPWLDDENLLPGQNWDQEIARAVRSSDIVIICLSQHSISRAGYLHKEIKYALDVAELQPEGTIFLIPLKLEECNIPERLLPLQWVNFFNERGYVQLLHSLRLRARTLGITLKDSSAMRASVGQSQLANSSIATRQAHATKSKPRNIVGRMRELDELRSCFRSVVNGKSFLICVTGEPGIGKTTLIEDFLAEIKVAKCCTIGRGRCSERLAGTEAYLPLLSALESLLLSESSASIEKVMKEIAPTWYKQFAPLSASGSDEQPPEAVKAASQERMKRELAVFVQEASRWQPLVIFFDDLHWADVSTIDLLSFLMSRFDSMRVLVIVAYRPSDMLLAKHPFLQIKPDLQAHRLCHEFPLKFLNQEDIAQYLALEFPEHKFPVGFPRLIHEKTEGSPLFMADLVRDLRDRNVIAPSSADDGSPHWTLAQDLPQIERDLPESIRGMIERKVAQLSDSQRKLLKVASVQGYEFDSAVIAKVMGIGAEEVEEQLEVLEQVYAFVRLMEESEFPNRILTLHYRFTHVLYQNALYRSLTATRRVSLSGAVAQTLREHYEGHTDVVASELAFLFEAARDFAHAAEYFWLAARNASQVFAPQEAVVLARRGLAMLETLPDSREYRERELSLQIVLGHTLMATSGYAAPEVEQAYSRARELSRQLGETSSLFLLLYGSCAFHVVKGDYSIGRELGEEFLTQAERQSDASVVVAHRMAGAPLMLTGALNKARWHFEQCLHLYDSEQHRPLTWLYGGEPGVAGRSYLALTLWTLGYPTLALKRSEEALLIAREVQHVHSQAIAFQWTAMLRQLRGETEPIPELLEALTVLASDHALAMWSAWVPILRGWVLAQEGKVHQAIELVRRGIDAFRATGAEMFRPYQLQLLAEVYAKAGQPRQGLDVLIEALAQVEKNEEHMWEAELHRLKGELLLRDGAPACEAEQCFHLALDIARARSAKSLELRAALSLTQLSQKTGDREEAREILADIYGWFSEGFETADLIEAKALLS